MGSLMLLFAIDLFSLSFFQEPNPIRASDWCSLQPCTNIFGYTINQLSSSILVYALSIYTCYLAFKLLSQRGIHLSKLYWGLSLLLGGTGALAAGTSFQAFAYEIKCAGKVFCSQDSHWEIAYYLLTASSGVLMLIGFLLSSLKRLPRPYLFGLAALYLGIYNYLCISSYMDGSATFASFNFMLVYMSPVYAFILGVSIFNYLKNTSPIHSAYLRAWGILSLTIVFYCLYEYTEMTSLLWQYKIWFSSNDVLHIGMFVWLIYLSKQVLPKITDYQVG